MSNNLKEIITDIEEFEDSEATEEDLRELLDVEDSNFNDEGIITSFNKKIQEVNNSNLRDEDKESLIALYRNAFTRLRNILSDNASGLKNEFSTEKDVPNRFVQNRLQNNISVVDDRGTQIRNYVNEQGLEIKQGYLNPILRQKQVKVLTIDSANRKDSTYKQNVITRSDASGNCVTTIEENEYILPENPGQFLINLEEPLKDVISLRILSYEIPVSWYNIDDAYGTDLMRIRLTGAPTWEEVILDQGNYKASSTNAALAPFLIAPQLEGKIQAIAGFGGATVSYNLLTYKITITNGAAFDMMFYDEEIDVLNPCSKEKTNATKKDNLGQTLGFRKPIYTGQTSYTGDSMVKLNSTNYLYISLNDFNSNFTNKIFTNAYDSDQPVIPSVPEYYNKNLYPTEVSGNSVFITDTDLTESCNNYPVQPPPTNTCTPALPDTPKLTQAQKYSIEQILTNKLNTKEIPQVSTNQPDSNTICRITNTISNDIDSLNEQLASLQGTIPNPVSRTYFGPVNIKKMEIKLFNDKGKIVDLNLQDWSFSIEITQLYQF